MIDLLSSAATHGYVVAFLVAGFYGAVGAARADYLAFKSWKQWKDYRTYNWGTATFRWFQGFVSSGITGLAAAVGADGLRLGMVLFIGR